MMKRLAIALTLLVLAASLVGCARLRRAVQSQTAATTPQPTATLSSLTTVTPARQEPAGVTILVEGQLVAVKPRLPLSLSTSGRLITVTVGAGDWVQAGDLIATIDDQPLQDAIAAAEAALAISQAQLAQLNAPVQQARVDAAQAQIEQAQASLDSAQASRNRLWAPADQAAIIEAEARVAEAQRDWDSARRNHEQVLLNMDRLGAYEEQARLQADAARTALAAAQARLQQLRAGPAWADVQAADAGIAQAEAGARAAQAQLDQLLTGPAAEEVAVLQAQIAQAELKLGQARRALADAQLVAPWAGLILTVDAAPGALVGAGTPIVTLFDPTELAFHTTNLSERDLAQVRPGQAVRVTLKAYPDQPLDGAITRIIPQASGMLGDAATFTAVIELAPVDLELLPGMTGRAEITIEAE